MIFIRFHIKNLILILLLSINMNSFAQKDSINYDSLARMGIQDILNMPVSGVSKFKETTNETPASVIIVTEEQIKENSYSDLSDLLKDIPGIDIVDNARGFGEYYRIRGIGGYNRFLVLVDGQKINPASGIFLSIGNSIPVKFAKRVEIIFGPTSAMYGSDAFAGIINIVSKDASDKIDIYAIADYGTANTVNTDISASFKLKNKLSFSFSGHLSKSDGPNFMGRDTIFDIINLLQAPLKNEFEQPIDDHSFFFKSKYKNFTLSYFNQKFNEGNALGMKPEYYIYNKENKWEMSNNIVWISYYKKISEKNILSFEAAYINHTQDPETQFLKRLNLTTLSESYSQYMTGIDNTLRSNISYNLLLSNNLKIISGVEYEYTNSIPPYANDEVFGFPVKYEGNVANIIKNELTIIEQRIAGFTQINFTPSKKIIIVLGGRYDYSLLYKNTFNPRMSFIYNPGKKTVIKILYGRAFQAPSLFYQYEQFGSANSVMLSVSEIQQTNPNWKLDNQIVNTFEVNINQKISKSINLNISTFHSFLSNLIEREIYTDSAYNKYFSTPDLPHYSEGIRNANIGSIGIFGISMKANIRITENLKSSVSYSFIDDQFNLSKNATNTLKGANHKFWLNITYLNLFKHINFSTNTKYIGKINAKDLIAFPTGKQPGYFNIDLNIRAVNIIKNTVFYIKINNLLNSEYSQTGILDGSVYLPSIPQNGFAIYGGIEFIFKKK